MKTRALRPNSRPARFAHIDRRTAEGRLFDQFRSALVAHIGHQPNAVQAAIVERACWMRLRLALMDEKLLAGEMTDIDSRCYLSWANSLGRLLARLGLDAAADKRTDPLSLSDYWSAKVGDAA